LPDEDVELPWLELFPLLDRLEALDAHLSDLRLQGHATSPVEAIGGKVRPGASLGMTKAGNPMEEVAIMAEAIVNGA
jgi:hypothetical protein